MKTTKAHSVKQSRKTDQLSRDNDMRFRADRKQVVDRVQRFHAHYKFIFGLQTDLTKNIAFSTNVNLKLFGELYAKYETAMRVVYGQLTADELYRVLDEDEDGYLNEDEQLLLYAIFNVQLLLLYEECIFFGYYEGIRKLDQVQDDLSRVVIELQTALRSNLYEEQVRIFKGNKEQIENRHISRFDRRMHDFRRFKEAKSDELQHMQMDKRFSTMLNANTKVSNFNFTKYSALQDIRIQEKFLGIFGNVEEAANLQRMYKKVFGVEQAKLSDKISQYTAKVTKNLENRFNFQNNMLEYKLNLQESILNQDFVNSKDLLLKKLRAQENKIKKLQSHLNAAVNTNFYRQNNLNKLKAQSKLKRDVVDEVRCHNAYKMSPHTYHSSVYQKHLSSSEQSKAVRESDLQRLIACRDSVLNYRFNLRRFDDSGNATMRRTGIVKDNDLKKINRLVNSTQLEQKKENKLCLAKFYDDNLELIAETD